MKSLSVLLSVLVYNTLIRFTASRDVSFEVDGGVLYDITWLSREEVVPDLDPDASGSSDDGVLAELLPNTLLGEGQWAEETIVMRTPENEQYECLLPALDPDSKDEADGNEGSTELTPEHLLQPLQHQCTRLLMGYWNYELCHGDYLRQYHEEKLQSGQVKVDEYMLGEYDDDLTDTPTPQPPPPQDRERIPVWPIHGREYPYYAVEMGGGTPCDIKNNSPRSVIIRYICDPEAYKYGSLLRVDEVTSCKYEALVSTPVLCQNPRYRLKEVPILPIKCYAQSDSPRRPKALLEQEIQSASFKASTTKATPTDQSGALYDDGRGDQSGSKVNERKKSRDLKGVELDIGFIRSFLNGDMCLRGGSGWWLHEVCNSAVVKQVHLESAGGREDVVLGVWDVEAHKEWFRRAGKKKMTKSQVVHLYKGGDMCHVTKTPRQCLVKYKCVKSAKPSQISLYLEEPTTCSYSLTVEGAFVCTLLTHTNEYGIFDLDSYEAAKDETEVGNEAGDVETEEETKDATEAAKKSTSDVVTEDRTDVSDEADGEVAKDETEPRDRKNADTATDGNQGNL